MNRNMKVVEVCNFFLFGQNNQKSMASEQLKDFFKEANPENAPNASEFVSRYRFHELVESLQQKYGCLPQGWFEQHSVYHEVSRCLFHIMSSTNLKVLLLGLGLLDTLASHAHRESNRFLLEAITDDRMLRQLRIVWKAHHNKTGGYSMRITENLLRWVQTWRDELVPPSQRKRFDPANQTKWSISAIQSSIKSYSNMNQNQLVASAQSGAHWFEKRAKEAAGISTKAQGIFSGLEQCHHKLKKRGANFPEIEFGSSSLRNSLDIQRCSENESLQSNTQLDTQSNVEQKWAAFAEQESPSSVAENVAVDEEDEFGDFTANAGALKISISPVKTKPDGNKKVCANALPPPPRAFHTTVEKSKPVATTAASFLDFGDFSATATTAPAQQPVLEITSGNPFDDDCTGNPFDDDSTSSVAQDASEDPFAVLAMRSHTTA